MEKLIELLNEYDWEPRKWKINSEWELALPWLDFVANNTLFEVAICSKKYWFIQWLVENEKIEWDEKFYLEDDDWLFGTYECLLMLLAIQDNPIEFLISILK